MQDGDERGWMDLWTAYPDMQPTADGNRLIQEHGSGMWFWATPGGTQCGVVREDVVIALCCDAAVRWLASVCDGVTIRVLPDTGWEVEVTPRVEQPVCEAFQGDEEEDALFLACLWVTELFKTAV